MGFVNALGKFKVMIFTFIMFGRWVWGVATTNNINIVAVTGTETPALSLRAINHRLSSVEPDLGQPLTINVVVRWVVLEP